MESTNKARLTALHFFSLYAVAAHTTLGKPLIPVDRKTVVNATGRKARKRKKLDIYTSMEPTLPSLGKPGKANRWNR